MDAPGRCYRSPGIVETAVGLCTGRGALALVARVREPDVAERASAIRERRRSRVLRGADVSTTLYRRNPDVVYRPEGRDGALLFDPDSAQVQVVNLTGAFIWERLDGTRPLTGICDELAGCFEDAPSDAGQRLAEAQAFVGVLVKIGFAGVVQP